MKEFFQNLFGKKSGQLELVVLDMKGMKKNWDFEVVSKSYIDSFGNEFLSIDDFGDYWIYQSIINHIPAENVEEYLKSQGVQLFVTEDIFETEKAYRYGLIVDQETAKACNFGTLRILKGVYEDQFFMFPLFEHDLDVQLFAYAVLTYGVVDPRMKKLVAVEENQKYLRMVLGNETFDQVLQKIFPS